MLATKSDVKRVTIPANFFTTTNKSEGEGTDKIQSDEKVKISQLYKGKALAVEMSCWRGLPTIYFIVDSKGTLLSGAPKLMHQTRRRHREQVSEDKADQNQGPVGPCVQSRGPSY